MKKVTISADKSGQAIVPSKENPDYGYVRVEQTRSIVDDNGWLKNKTIAALILGTVSELQKAGYQAGQELAGKVIVREQTTPFNKKNPEKDFKIAGDTGITCMVEDKPIYRKAFYSQDEEVKDVLIAHTNGEAIKAAYAKKVAAEGSLELE